MQSGLRLPSVSRDGASGHPRPRAVAGGPGRVDDADPPAGPLHQRLGGFTAAGARPPGIPGQHHAEVWLRDVQLEVHGRWPRGFRGAGEDR